MTESMVRPELVELQPAERERVLQQVAAKGGYCESCGGTEFHVGRALYLGFLFLDEDQDAYMVALTCRNPDCRKPRTGIRLRENDFLDHDGESRAASWRIGLPRGA
ncbi:hypothetical protein BMW24_015540 [Mycobacterium heckeshornense]|uniref:Uncharacterized protein n=1 Tax=Mycobacterium heckeshornense TaxID=110505 RepID=A0A2G8B7A4_9MYCO|nr:hypothetical protein [Mycobacterium heckeshornense]PIJ33614.1 hypothetical protein BMW24_015540 [Mycobacterium heckeshornense]BCO36708.1 hypothetical protein MHEC_31410 [Mycobacterium heckeshornense]BCQ09601.1 hypothetical protein JMUB5695_03046 [Mycobacterium heckeshornense]HZS20269.1 hypothetical protein [Pseudonocardiaceae bacterium]